MAYLAPTEFVTKMIDAGESKIFMSTRDTLIRSYMAGAILSLAAAFELDVPAVQRAGNALAMDDALRQWATFVRALVVQCEHVVFRGAEDGDNATACLLHDTRAELRDVFQRADQFPVHFFT